MTRPTGEVDLLIGINYAQLQPNAIKKKENLVLYESQFGTGKLLGGQHRNIIWKDRVSVFTKIVAHAKVRNVEVVRTNPKNVDFFTAERC